MPDRYGVLADVHMFATAPADDRFVGVLVFLGFRLHGAVPVAQVHRLSRFVTFGEGVDDGNHVTSAQRSTPPLVALQPPDPPQVPPELQP